MKQELSKLSQLVRKLSDLLDDQMLTTVSVVLHNMAFESDDKPEFFFNPYLDVLESFKDLRPDHHVLSWVNTETLLIVHGHFLSLEESLNDCRETSNPEWREIPNPEYNEMNALWYDWKYTVPKTIKVPVDGDEQAQDFETFGNDKI
jgi:hypothetical protein